MRDEFMIMIADRNRNVREFLRREFEAEGYRVRLARDGREVLKMTSGGAVVDLLILDLDMPYVDGVRILKQLKEKKPSIPVLIHTTSLEYEGHSVVQEAVAFMEKTGNNIVHLKTLVVETLKALYPYRFMHAKREPEDKEDELHHGQR
jgi:CheY-like chemotaxis protein